MKKFTRKKGGLREFITRMENDSGLRERLQQSADNYGGDKTDMNEVVSNTVLPVAKEEGFEFSAGEYMEYLKTEVERRLVNTAISDDELSVVSGGVNDVEMQKSQTGGNVTIVDQHTEIHTTQIFVIITQDTPIDTVKALGQALAGK